LFESVPPQGYGGTERVVSYLSEALVAMGHEVTLYASGDSVTRAELVAVVPTGLRQAAGRPEWLMWHMQMLDRVFAAADRYDVIHFHTDYLHYPLARRCTTPTLTTMHGRLDLPDLAALHRHFDDQALVSISAHQQQQMPDARWLATVHHGLPTDLHRAHDAPGDYFAFIGRMSPEKRADRAIEVARRTDMPIKLAAKVDPVDEAYFEREIQPLLGSPLAEFVGEIGGADKKELLNHARALLFPIDWAEPFGLVMIEAMACGTPVIAYRSGSVPEVIEDGVNGFIVDDIDGAVDAVGRLGQIDRATVRAAFEDRFTAERMARDYVRLYQKLIGRDSAAEEPMTAEAPAAPV
jgi:glycosyltransferase involved in cell wall biosynthesis